MTRTFVRFLLVTVTLLTLACGTAVAQSAAATLSGVFQDASGAVVPGVHITVLNKATSLARTATTNSEGFFTVPLLPPGTYTLAALAEGFAPVEVRDIALSANDQRLVSLKLEVRGVSQSITVDGGSLGIDLSPAISTVVDREFVANMPLNGRTFQSLILLAPGVVMGDGAGQLSFNGQRTNANYFTIDGVSGNIGVSRIITKLTGPTSTSTGDIDQSGLGGTPGFNSFGGTNNLIAADALDEIKVETSTYSAKQGRQPGGQVGITSRSGSNRLHGSLFEYFRNDALDANDWFLNAKKVNRSPLRQNDFGGTLGGPVLKNRTFFFFSYEGLRQMLPQTAIENRVPAAYLRNDPTVKPEIKALLSAFPMPNGPDYLDSAGKPTGQAPFFVGSSNPQIMNSTSLRMDHKVSSKLTAFGRYSKAPSRSESYLVAQRSRNETNTMTLTAGLTAIISAHLTNDLRFNTSGSGFNSVRAMTTRYGATPPDPKSLLPASAPEGAVLTINLPGGGIINGPTYQNRQRQINIVDTVTWVLGRHTLHAGFDGRFMLPRYAFRPWQGMVLISTPANVLAGTSSYVSVSTTDQVTVLSKNFSSFVGDTWRVGRRLTLDLGLRWEVNPPPSGRNRPLMTLTGFPDLTKLKLAPAGTPLYPTRHSGFAPRLGLAYTLRSPPGWETVLRGGYGLTYDLGSGTSGSAATMFPNNRARITQATIPYPIAESYFAAPAPLSLNPPYTTQDFTIVDPGYVLPRTHQWSVSLSQSIGSRQTLTASYVGSAGRRLLRRYFYGFDASKPVNPDFPGSTLNITRNSPDYADTSDYNALQVQLMRRMHKRLQALANYTWSHTLDTGSDDNYFDFSGRSPSLSRGNSSFDRRHIFNTAITYELPSVAAGRTGLLGWLGGPLLNHWATDYTFKAQSGTPFDVTYRAVLPGYGYGFIYRADRTGQPDWIEDAKAPGGRRLNPAAFRIPPRAYGAADQVGHGSLGRGSLRGFSPYQLDFVLRRGFKFGDRMGLQFRAEFFNVLNHPNFGRPSTSIGSLDLNKNFTPDPQLGVITTMLGRRFSGSTLSPLYQMGGPRSVQLVLKLSF